MARRPRAVEFVAEPPSKPPSAAWRVYQFVFGRPLASHEEQQEQIGIGTGIPLLGLDALGSAAYGPEAALTLLMPLGLMGLRYITPLIAVVVALLSVVFVSYRQTIAAYPGGGGSYTVAKENLGERASLVAAAALSLDYMLNVSVAISAGVSALISAAPRLMPFQLPLCLCALMLITIANLRGSRTAGLIFMIPTYLFIVSLLAVIAVGVVRAFSSGGHPIPATPVRPSPQALGAASAWLIIRAFASGCTAMTGVEAVSDGVPAFKQPSAKRAQACLGAIIGTLVLLLLGVGWLCRAYGITAVDPHSPAYRSILSQLTEAVWGRGPLYYLTISSVVAVLMLSANTSFADFPRLCRFLARDGFLPEPFIHRGRRLAFTFGIGALAIVSGVLLIAFRGITDAFIPLFAVGAFLAFTLSQAGMVAHWRRAKKKSHWRLALNGVGALATGLTLVVVVASKFLEGAWITVLLMVGLLALFYAVNRHYRALEPQIRADGPLDLSADPAPILVVPIRQWNRLTQRALRFAMDLSPRVLAVQVLTGDHAADDLSQQWETLVQSPSANAARPSPRLVVLRTEYRSRLAPLEEFIKELAHENRRSFVAVLFAELIERHWYHRFLHRQTASILRALLRLHGESNIVLIDMPWYSHEALGTPGWKLLPRAAVEGEGDAPHS